MVQGLVGKKLGMTEIYSPEGKIQAVTAIEAGPCTVVQLKTDKKEGYNAVQLGFGAAKKINSPLKGHQKGLGQFRHLRELRVNSPEGIELGRKFDVSLFKPGDLVDVSGVTKGKGFAGVVKRHGFAGGPKTHGQSDRWRHPGSIGSTTTPGRVWKGMKMAGHMGVVGFTVRHLKVVTADPARNLLLVNGPVPGGRNGILLIKKSVKRK